MKHIYIALCAAVMPMTVAAQTDVSKAFTDFIANPAVQSTENHYMEKDPLTKKKSGQYDIYKFTISPDDINLIDNVEKAFMQDSDEAYSISCGTQSGNMAPLSLAVGNGNDGVYLAQNVGDRYLMACFLDPEDPDNIYRYAYAIEWNDSDGQLKGTLAVTYSTTLSYRQQMAEQQMHGVRNLASQSDTDQYALLDLVQVFNNSLLNENQPTWFSQFMFLISCMSEDDIPTCQAFAGKIYELVKLADEWQVSDDDRDTAVRVLSSLMNGLNANDQKFQDPIISSLLKGSIKSLRK